MPKYGGYSLKIGTHHSKYIANRIALDLSRGSYINLLKDLDSLIETIHYIVEFNLANEKDLEDHVKEVMEEHRYKIEYNFADEREVFKMIKQELAPEYDFLISYEERLSELSHRIVGELLYRDIIEPRVSYIQIASSISDSIDNYIKSRGSLETIVVDKLRKFKKKFDPTTNEYKTMFNKLYEDELKLRGGLK